MKIHIDETESFPRNIILTINGESELQTFKDLIDNINIDRTSVRGKRIYNLKHMLWYMINLPNNEENHEQ